MCVKRALPKLRVAADWHAPIERNLYESRWMQVANDAVPGAAPQVLGQHPRLGVLVMRYLSPADHRLWKDALRDGHADVATARAVGATLVRIHAFTAARGELAAQFATDAIFFDIRLDPYLLATGRRHPDLAPALAALVERTRTHKLALVHGDVSPKNIVVGPGGPVFLDAECAWWGDPAFDLAFCLNHLLLKCLWNPAARTRVPRLLRRARRTLSARRRLGAAGSARATRGSAAARAPAGTRRRQVAGRVSARRGPARHGAARRASLPVRAGRTARRDRRGVARGDLAMSGARIRSVHARRVWDSRGRPTVEAEVTLDDGATGRAICPAGASKGTREALELRDGGSAFAGLDVARAVANVEGEIASALRGAAADDQEALDRRLIDLDGTPAKSRLGANATLAVSMATAHAVAASRRLPLYESLGGPQATLLPMPQIQIFGGGAHAAGASTSRTSWSSAPARATSARRSSGRRRSTATPAR